MDTGKQLYSGSKKNIFLSLNFYTILLLPSKLRLVLDGVESGIFRTSLNITRIVLEIG